MVPSSFPESNDVAYKNIESEEDIQALSVLRAFSKNGDLVTISCWKVTEQELEEINRTKRVWVIILGKKVPPITIEGQRPIIAETLADGNE